MGDAPGIDINFVGQCEPQLESITYSPSGNYPRRLCVRGKDFVGGTDHASGSFQWTSAVRAMSILIVKASIVSRNGSNDRAVLSGESGTFAASLDYAIGKQPQWLLDMFGVSADGVSVARRLIRRSNPERKRPGPVVLSWNDKFCEPSRIKVFRAGRELVAVSEIEALLHELERSSSSVPYEPARRSTRAPAHHRDIREARTLLAAAGATGLMMLPFSLSDFLLDTLDENGPMQLDALLRESRARLPFALSGNFAAGAAQFLLQAGVIGSTRRGVSPTEMFETSRTQLLASAAGIAKSRQAEFERLGKSICEIRFKSLSEMDRFLAEFYQCCLRASRQPSTSWWHLAHSLWPLLRPVEECQRANSHPDYANTSYACAGSTRVDKWAANFYRKLGVRPYLGVPLLFDSDFWIIGDTLVSHVIPTEVQGEINSFVQENEDVANFDNVALHRNAYSTSADCIVRVAVAPGLSSSLGENLRARCIKKAA